MMIGRFGANVKVPEANAFTLLGQIIVSVAQTRDRDGAMAPVGVDSLICGRISGLFG